MKDLDYEEINLLVKDKIVEYDANKKYLASTKNKFVINIYKFPENENIKGPIYNKYENIFCSINAQDIIQDFKLNQNYLNILLVANPKKILFFSIPEDFQETQIIEPRYIFKANNIIISSVEFNPINSHIIALYSSTKLVQIWTMRGNSIQNINCKNYVTEIKWNNCGKLLGITDEKNIIKIYNIFIKKFIYILDFTEPIIEFNFFMNDKILVHSTKKIIFVYKFDINHKEKSFSENKTNYQLIIQVDCGDILINNNYFLLYSRKNKMQIYNNFTKPIYSNDISLFNVKVIKTSNDNIIFKILNVNINHVQVITIKNKFNLLNIDDKKDVIYNKLNEEEVENYNSFIDTFDFFSDNLKEDYFKDYPPTYLNIFYSLHYKYNEDISDKKERKKYFKISELKKNMENNRNINLIILRNEVEKDIKLLIKKEELIKKEKGEEDLKLFKSIKEEYMFLLNLLIKDETNKELLKRYLFFLKKNEFDLEKEKIPYETFKNELEYYSIFFEKKELIELFQSEYKSQKEILINLLNDYMNNIKNKTIEKFKEEIKNKIKVRYFNQPISFKFIELIYYDCIYLQIFLMQYHFIIILV